MVLGAEARLVGWEHSWACECVHAATSAELPTSLPYPLVIWEKLQLFRALTRHLEFVCYIRSGDLGSLGTDREGTSGIVRRALSVKRSIRYAAAAVLIAFPLAAAAGELRVTVEGIRSARGTVLIGLYDSPQTFERAFKASDRENFLNDPDRFGAVAIRANAALRSAVVFSNLEPGRYAVIAFHDENGNGKLDKN